MKSYKQTTRENPCQIFKRLNKNYNTHSFATYKDARVFLACLPSLCVAKIRLMCASSFAAIDEEFLYIGNLYGDAQFKISDLCDFILCPLVELKDTVFAFQFNKFLTPPHNHVVTWLKQTKLKTHYVAKNNYKNGINVARHNGVVTTPRFDLCLFEQIFDAFYQQFIFHPTIYMSYIISSYIKSIINKHYFDEWWNNNGINEPHMLRVKLKIFNSFPISARFEKKYIPDWKKIELVCEGLPTTTIQRQNHYIIKDVDNVVYNMLACFANIGLEDVYKKLNSIYTLFSPDIISQEVHGYDLTCDQIILRDYSHSYGDISVANPRGVYIYGFKHISHRESMYCVDESKTELFNSRNYARAFDLEILKLFQFFIHPSMSSDDGGFINMKISKCDTYTLVDYLKSINTSFIKFFGGTQYSLNFFNMLVSGKFKTFNCGIHEDVLHQLMECIIVFIRFKIQYVEFLKLIKKTQIHPANCKMSHKKLGSMVGIIPSRTYYVKPLKQNSFN